MKDVEVLVFGANVPTCGCGAKSMREEAWELKALLEKFVEVKNFNYVDVKTEKMKEYPEIIKVLPEVRLPLTVINGKPKFHGGFSFDMIAGAISELLQENK